MNRALRHNLADFFACTRLKPHLRCPAFWLMLALTAACTLISLTNRYDATVGVDEVWDVRNAYNLVHHGEMPRHSGVSGFFALIPPGVTFAFVPGALLAPHNPEAAERIGAALMYFGTLLGLYLWLDKRFGFWPAALSMLIFSAGSTGAFFATSLWPRAHPFFLIWMLYPLTLWVERKDGRFLAMALFVYAAGMYWYMEMATAILVVPILYALYAPPIRWKWLFAAGGAGLLLWSPYLVFEAHVNFADIKALVTQKFREDHVPTASILYNPSNHPVDALYAESKIAEARETARVEPSQNTGNIDKDRWCETRDFGIVWLQPAKRQYLGEEGYWFYSAKLGDWAFQSVTNGRIVRKGHDDWETKAYAMDFPAGHTADTPDSANATGNSTAQTDATLAKADKERWYYTEDFGLVWFQPKERQQLGEPGYYFHSTKLGGWTFQSVTSGRIILKGQSDWENTPYAVAFPTNRKPEGFRLRLIMAERKLMTLAPLKCLVAGNSFGIYAWHVLLLTAALIYAFFASGALSQTAAAARYWWGVIIRKPHFLPDGATENRAAWCVIFTGTFVPPLALVAIMRGTTIFDDERRFWWLWIGYALAIGCFAGCAHMRGRKALVPLGILAVATLSFNAKSLETYAGAFKSWPGDYKAPNDQAIDKLAEIMARDGRREARIGYDFNFTMWQVDTHVIDGVSKEFVEWDEALLWRHGIRNLETCAEGLSPHDDYLVRSTDFGYADTSDPKVPIASKRWSMTIDGSMPKMENVANAGGYEIWRKIP